MGRRKSNPVGQLFFNYDKEKDISTCEVEGCQRSILKGGHSNNLETHIRSYHPEEYKILIDAKNEQKGVTQIENVQTNNMSALFSLKVNVLIYKVVI